MEIKVKNKLNAEENEDTQLRKKAKRNRRRE